MLGILGQHLNQNGASIAVLLLVGLLTSILINVFFPRLSRYLENLDNGEDGDRDRRIRTFMEIGRRILLAVLWVVVIATLLTELGINILPLVTAAGIGGLALGLGSQNLFRDLIAGVFLFVENQIRIGDVVQINGVGGTVERMNLRTTILRDINGTLHIFPNGAISAVGNLTKDWSRYVVDVGVAYKEDVDHCMEVLQEIGDSLMQDPKLSPLILEPLQVLGVDKLDSYSVIIKAMITTKPLQQWTVGRELNRRIKNVFAEKGIEIPYPRQTIDLNQPPAQEP